MSRRTAFGASLRRERERRGITLEAISEETKVSASLLDALERGDVSRWPAGIFRRAFVRAYAEAIGLESRAVLTEFLAAFPDDNEPLVSAVAEPATDEEVSGAPLRLTLAGDTRATVSAHLMRAAGAAVDILGALAVAIVVMLLIGGGWRWDIIAIALGAWFTLGAIATGRTPGLWAIARSSGQTKKAAAPRVQLEEDPAEIRTFVQALSIGVSPDERRALARPDHDRRDPRTVEH